MSHVVRSRGHSRLGKAVRGPFAIGPFIITPMLTDHSAFDAYMLLVETAGKRILYTGDFRRHGRKSALVDRMMAKPPTDIDVLLTEGTNLGSDKPVKSEDEVERDFVELFKATKGRIFVSWSGQNIDRTVTLYRAAKRTDRTLAIDLYVADVLDRIAEGTGLPRPGLSEPEGGRDEWAWQLLPQHGPRGIRRQDGSVRHLCEETRR